MITLLFMTTFIFRWRPSHDNCQISCLTTVYHCQDCFCSSPFTRWQLSIHQLSPFTRWQSIHQLSPFTRWQLPIHQLSPFTKWQLAIHQLSPFTRWYLSIHQLSPFTRWQSVHQLSLFTPGDNDQSINHPPSHQVIIHPSVIPFHPVTTINPSVIPFTQWHLSIHHPPLHQVTFTLIHQLSPFTRWQLSIH